MDIIITILISLSFFVLIFIFLAQNKRKTVAVVRFNETQIKIIEEHISFYRALGDKDKESFREKMQQFLSRVRITGVNTVVDDVDKMLVAASAIIPIFHFAEWEYININEVLLHKDSFSEDFTDNELKNTLGIVGDGAYQNVMVLSKSALRRGFSSDDSLNVGIHEFVHLLDKTDGAVDGIPEAVISKQYIIPWLKLMQDEMKQLMQKDSDINVYGATNQAEFFAVVSEYFFEKPHQLQKKHPDLFRMLEKIFRPV